MKDENNIQEHAGKDSWEDAGRRNAFSQPPEGYFEKLNEAVMERAARQPLSHAPLSISRKRKWYAVAAVITLFLASSIILWRMYSRPASLNIQAELQKIPAEEITQALLDEPLSEFQIIEASAPDKLVFSFDSIAPAQKEQAEELLIRDKDLERLIDEI